MRNHLIHGLWTLSENENGEFLVENFRSVRGEERLDSMWVGQKELDALLHDVRNLSAWIVGFKVSKMLHASQGLLQASSSQQLDSHQPSPE